MYVHSMGTTLPRVCEELLVTTCQVLGLEIDDYVLGPLLERAS